MNPLPLSESEKRLREQVLAAASQEDSPLRTATLRGRLLALALMLVTSATFFALMGGVVVAERSWEYLLATVVLGVGGILAGVSAFLRRGTAYQGVLGAVILGFGVIGAIVFEPLHSQPTAMSHHVGCAVMGLLFSVPVVVYGLWVRRRSAPVAPHWTSIGVGLLGSALGAAAGILHCEVAHAPHVVGAHLVTAAATIVVAAYLGTRFVKPERGRLTQ